MEDTHAHSHTHIHQPPRAHISNAVLICSFAMNSKYSFFSNPNRARCVYGK